MRLVLESDSRIHTVRSYGPGEILVSGQRCTAPCIVSPSQLITQWMVGAPQSLQLTDLQPLLALNPRIVLLGLPDASVIPPGRLRRELEARAIALEYMELGAACRTYNVLAQEGRLVVAGLFTPPLAA